MESFDLSTLHGGYGSDLMLAMAAMQELRLARDRELRGRAARGARSSRAQLARHGRLGAPLLRLRARSRAGLLDEAIDGYDRALRRGRAPRRRDAPRVGAHVPRPLPHDARRHQPRARRPARGARPRARPRRAGRARLPLRLPDPRPRRARRARRGAADARAVAVPGGAAAERAPQLLPPRPRPAAGSSRARSSAAWPSCSRSAR